MNALKKDTILTHYVIKFDELLISFQIIIPVMVILKKKIKKKKKIIIKKNKKNKQKSPRTIFSVAHGDQLLAILSPDKLRVAYNNAYRRVLGYVKSDSASNKFVNNQQARSQDFEGGFIFGVR